VENAELEVTVRLRVQIPSVKPGLMKRQEVCPKEGCEGKHFKPHQKNCAKLLQDIEYDQVNVERWKCLRCKGTFRVYPEGVSEAQRSDRLKGANVLLYLLGLSYGGVEDFMGALGHPVGKTTVYRDVQAAGEQVRELREDWLGRQAGRVRVVGGDPTHVRCQGKDVIVGVTVDAEAGTTLDICILDNERADTLTDWLKPMIEMVGARVLITDDADGLKTAADQAGVHHQVCRQHATPNLLAFIAEVAPKKGQRASIWYRMRNHILHLWENWKRLTCYCTLKYTEGLEVDATNNCSERVIGWAVKERYRTMRGYKRKRSILNVTGLTAWLLDQPPGYQVSPLFAS